MGHTLDILLETFTWVGFGAGALFAGVALIVFLADGTWLPASAMLESTPEGRVARWFAHDGGVGSAILSPHDDAHVGAADETELYYRVGSNRVRLSPRSPAVRLTAWLAFGFLALGALSLVVSLVMMFAVG
jgi:hypothetical protein